MKKMITIEADKARNLKYGFNALIELEEVMGKPLTTLELDKVALKDLRAMLFVGLKHEDKELTLEATGDVMDAVIENHGMEYLGQKLAEAMTGAFGNMPVPSEK